MPFKRLLRHLGASVFQSGYPTLGCLPFASPERFSPFWCINFSTTFCNERSEYFVVQNHIMHTSNIDTVKPTGLHLMTVAQADTNNPTT